jgi:hypothetical protein
MKTQPDVKISDAEARRLVQIARNAAGGGSDLTCIRILLTLCKFFANQSDEMKSAAARELLALARVLDPLIDNVANH